jgi:hypothetical protein
MSSTFVIHARREWTFQLVLLGSRMRLEGWCDGPEGCCSAWMQPHDAPHEVAERLIGRPSCCL